MDRVRDEFQLVVDPDLPPSAHLTNMAIKLHANYSHYLELDLSAADVVCKTTLKAATEIGKLLEETTDESVLLKNFKRLACIYEFKAAQILDDVGLEWNPECNLRELTSDDAYKVFMVLFARDLRTVLDQMEIDGILKAGVKHE